jgi:hypothetical protein
MLSEGEGPAFESRRVRQTFGPIELKPFSEECARTKERTVSGAPSAPAKIVHLSGAACRFEREGLTLTGLRPPLNWTRSL